MQGADFQPPPVQWVYEQPPCGYEHRPSNNEYLVMGSVKPQELGLYLHRRVFVAATHTLPRNQELSLYLHRRVFVAATNTFPVRLRVFVGATNTLLVAKNAHLVGKSGWPWAQ